MRHLDKLHLSDLHGARLKWKAPRPTTGWKTKWKDINKLIHTYASLTGRKIPSPWKADRKNEKAGVV